ncbi:MAG TPA: TIGR02206 family membrane protein [Humisphaera sp.]
MSHLAATFTPYGPSHLATLAVVAVAAWAVGKYGGRATTDRGRRRVDLVVGSVALGQWLVVQALELRPAIFDLQASLPVHICDLVGLAGALAVLTNLRVFRAMLYYWGVGLSIGALFMPELAGGPESEEFWRFWVPHGAIVVLAAYDIFARRYRPAWKDYFIAIGTLVAYLAIIIPVDSAYGLVYGYVGPNRPGYPHLMDFLGEWPGRLGKLVMATLAFLAAITLPWEYGRRRGRLAATAKAKPAAPQGRRPMVDGLEDRISV